MKRRHCWVLAIAVVLSGCDSGAENRASNQSETAQDSSKAAGNKREWVTVIQEGNESHSAVPRPFRVSGDSVRILVRPGERKREFLSGVIVANILSDTTTLPSASLRFERAEWDSVYTDTAVIKAGPGELYLFVPEASNFTRWTITVQDGRR